MLTSDYSNDDTLLSTSYYVLLTYIKIEGSNEIASIINFSKFDCSN
jgi:hypothetical protein